MNFNFSDNLNINGIKNCQGNTKKCFMVKSFSPHKCRFYPHLLHLHRPKMILFCSCHFHFQMTVFFLLPWLNSLKLWLWVRLMQLCRQGLLSGVLIVMQCFQMWNKREKKKRISVTRKTIIFSKDTQTLYIRVSDVIEFGKKHQIPRSERRPSTVWLHNPFPPARQTAVSRYLLLKLKNKTKSVFYHSFAWF